jgi:Domain of unknown function (DUF4350)
MADRRHTPPGGGPQAEPPGGGPQAAPPGDGPQAEPPGGGPQAAPAGGARQAAARRRGRVTPLRALVGVVVLFVAVSVAIDRYAPTPSGPEGSSYATAPEGAAAYAELLHRAGHTVRRVRTPLAERPVDPVSTLIVLDPEGVVPDEARAIGRFVRAGGRLVAAGASARWLARVLDAPPVWAPSARGEASVVVPVPETAGVTTVAFAEGGRWEPLGGALPILATPEGAVAAVAESGAGRVVLLADAAPLYNGQLARADDAAFGLAIAGPERGAVAFLETVHGYGEATGLAALPTRALWVLAGLAVAALALVWSMARRLGPPEDEARPPAPPRRDYVEAVAAGLAASGDRAGVVDAAARAARRRLEQRAGVRPGAGEPELREAAARFGLDDAETAALLGHGDDPVAAGRALARLEARR